MNQIKTNRYHKVANRILMTGLIVGGAAGLSSIQGTTANADQTNSSTDVQQVQSNHNDMYLIKAGDTLSNIAAKNNMSISQLQMINNLSSPDMIQAGTYLNLNGHGSKPTDNYHTVNVGDTLNKLSSVYNISVDDLKNLNNLSNDDIEIGQKLLIRGHVNNTQVKTTDMHNESTKVKNIASNEVSANNVKPLSSTIDKNNASNNASNNNNKSINTNSSTNNISANDQAAKDWIASHESSGNYGARNGNYVGRYQLDASYLHGDYSPANQERVAQNYVQSRYGSWSNAQSFWQAHGWY